MQFVMIQDSHSSLQIEHIKHNMQRMLIGFRKVTKTVVTLATTPLWNFH